MNEKIAIGVSDYKTSSSPDMLMTYAIGSCVGISFYDPVEGIGGLSHVMLQNSSLKTNGVTDERMKLADTSIDDMLSKMKRLGANRSGIFVNIADGANMFGTQEDTFIETIGNRNIVAVHAIGEGVREL